VVQDDRIEIADGLGRGEPVKANAARIGKSYQSIYREIAATASQTAATSPGTPTGRRTFAAVRAGRYPAIIKVWRAHWAEFSPFLAFPPEVRRVIYTTNLIESMNARLRKVTLNRGQFPSEQAALKVLYLAVRNLEDYRSPTTGISSPGWRQALQAFTIYFDGPIPTP
jgi:transposase-like protein